MIGRMPGAAKFEVLVFGRKLIAIEHYLDLATVARHASELLVLTAFAEFSQVRKGSVGRGYAGVVFLDPSTHFLHQDFLQSGGMAEHAIGIAVLGFEIFSDIRVEDAGVAQDLLPVRVLQPCIIIDNRDAMSGECMWPARCDR